MRIAVSRISYQGKNASGVIIATFKKKNDRINAMDVTVHEEIPEEEDVLLETEENNSETVITSDENGVEETVIAEENTEDTEE